MPFVVALIIVALLGSVTSVQGSGRDHEDAAGAPGLEGLRDPGSLSDDLKPIEMAGSDEEAEFPAASVASDDEPDSVIVRFRDDVRPGTRGRERAHERSGGRSPRQLTFARGFEVAEVPPGVTAEELAARYSEDPNVLYAEPNITVELTAVPDDAYFGRQWSLKNDGQQGGVPGADIGILEAWGATRGSEQTVVAVIDTGVDYTHVDLASQMWAGMGYDFYNGDDDPMDNHGHGTHVASTVAAAAGDGFGIAGVAPDVRIMALKAFEGTNGTLDAIIDSIAYAEAYDADIINASWTTLTASVALREAILASSALVVAAAGNSGSNSDFYPEYPAAWNDANILAVAATGRMDELATFSNYGTGSTDIGAPGVDILGAVPGRESVSFYDGFADMSSWVAEFSQSNEWGTAGERFTSSPLSLSDSPDGTYANGEDSFVRMRDVLDLSGVTDARLEFEMWLDTEAGFDGVLAYGHDGEAWSVIEGWSGSTGGSFDSLQVDLVDYVGMNEVRVGFRFISDETGTGEGAYIDDLRVVSSALTGPSSRHEYKSGTSMAAPHAAGVAALLLSGVPDLTAAELKQAIRDSVTPLSSLTGKVATGGRLDAGRLFRAPAVAGFTSPSHGDSGDWSNVSDVVFTWLPSAHVTGLDGYAASLSDDPDAISAGEPVTATVAHFDGIADGEWHVAVRARTALGLWGPVTRSTVRIDTVAPESVATIDPLDPDGLGGWYVTQPTIMIDSTDDASGVGHGEWSLDGLTWTQGAVVTGVPDGDRLVHYRAVDMAGNVETTRTIGLRLDTTPPVTASDAVSSYEDSATVILEATDETSGVARTYYSINGDPASLYEGPLVCYTPEVSNVLSYWSVDAAGNVEPTRTVTFAIDDVTPPVSEAVFDPPQVDGDFGWYRTVPSVEIRAEDFGPGVDFSEWWFEGDTEATRASDVVGFGDGRHILHFRSGDHAGNVEASQTVEFDVDSTVPDVSHVGGGVFDDSVTLRLHASDAMSGVREISWTGDRTGTVTADTASLRFTEPGEYSIVYWAKDMAGNTSPMGRATVTVPATDVTRLSGSDRYATAVALAREGYPGFAGVTHVVIASGEDRFAADPLAAAGLTGVLDAPLMLVHSGGVPASVRSAIQSIPGDITVVIIGGTAAVPREVGIGLSSIRNVERVDRVAGLDRYATARAIADRMKTELAKRGKPMPDVALLANGANPASFFDALALSTIAANNHYPILLLERDRVPATTLAALSAHGLSTRVIGGGPAVVTDRVRSQLGAERWAGADRYATAAEIARRSVARGWSGYGTVGVAASFPDAITGGATLGSKGGLLLLTERDRLTPVTSIAIRTNRSKITDLYVFGGTAAVSERVRTQMIAQLQ